MDFNYLKNKRFLVTGGTSGIGLEIVSKLLSFGSELFVIGRDFTKIRDLNNANVTELPVDLNQVDEKGINFIIGILKELEINLDGVVFAAGMARLTPFKFFNPSDFEEIKKVNLDSSILILNALIRMKCLKPNCSFVFIGSISTERAIKGNLSYSLFKSSLISMVKILTLEFASKGYRFNVVSPGMVKTKIYMEQLENLSLELIKEDEQKYPLGYGAPQDVANLVIFLLSKYSSWITGQNYIIDGGRTCT